MRQCIFIDFDALLTQTPINMMTSHYYNAQDTLKDGHPIHCYSFKRKYTFGKDWEKDSLAQSKMNTTVLRGHTRLNDQERK